MNEKKWKDNMNVLVTGGSGYFGSLLLGKLLERGYNCRILDLNDTADRPEGTEFFQADIRDIDAVDSACEGMDIVHHNVAQVPLAKDKTLFNSVNIGGMANLLDACKNRKIKKVIYTSSSAVFGVPQSLPVTENTVPIPAEAYGEAKAAAEKLCREAAAAGLDISIIRPRTILGHGRLGIFQILFEWVSEGRRIPVLGDGSNVYQFIHADDLAEVCIRAGNRQGPEIYNCGAEKFGTMRDLLQNLCNHAGTGARVYSIPMGLAVAGMKITSKLGLSPLGDYHCLMYGRSMYFDTYKVRKILGYTTRYSNEEMINESYDWYMKNRPIILSSKYKESTHKSAVNQGILRLLKRIS
jgi:nucleoside-diphosphate-sugar epimerase